MVYDSDYLSAKETHIDACILKLAQHSRMPQGKVSRYKLVKQDGEGQVEPHHDIEQLQQPMFSQEHASSDGKLMLPCCSPRQCRFSASLVNPARPGSAVKVVCNNEECTQSGWMHQECFNGKELLDSIQL